MILDIHTHSLSPNPQAVIDISSSLREASVFSIPESYEENQLFSAGIHPWWISQGMAEDMTDKIEAAALNPQMAIIGEAGIDIPNGGPLFRQMLTFKKMIAISEKSAKPLLIHDVKAHDIIIGIHKELKPEQPWIIHGFRGKPSVAEMLLREGFHLSFGQNFNPAALCATPTDRILAETDESTFPITEIIRNLSAAYGSDLTDNIAQNTSRILNLQDI